jgi:hypothetical protein
MVEFASLHPRLLSLWERGELPHPNLPLAKGKETYSPLPKERVGEGVIGTRAKQGVSK